VSINFAQFPQPRLPLQGGDLVVGYQLIGSVPTLAQYTLTQMFLGVFPGGNVPVSSGGTGLSAVPAGDLLVGTGTNALGLIAPGAAGQTLISQGASVSPQFGNNPIITGGSIDGAPIGNTTPSNGSFTTLSATGAVSGAGFTARFASPGPIGNTAASTGAFTTLSSTGTFTPSSTNGIVGTVTNDNANAGSVGEFATNTASGVSVSSGTPFNATSVSLTAGDWDVSGSVQFIGAGVTSASFLGSGISTTSATLGAVGSLHVLQFTMSGPTANHLPTPILRLSLASTTTVFLVAQAVFSGGTFTANGLIRARRVR
jgi:hypothetical protein